MNHLDGYGDPILYIISLYLYEVQCIPLDDERIAFGVLEAFDFEVNVEVGPLDGFGAAHLNVEHAADGRVLHPRDAVV